MDIETNERTEHYRKAFSDCRISASNLELKIILFSDHFNEVRSALKELNDLIPGMSPGMVEKTRTVLEEKIAEISRRLEKAEASEESSRQRRPGEVAWVVSLMDFEKVVPPGSLLMGYVRAELEQPYFLAEPNASDLSNETAATTTTSTTTTTTALVQTAGVVTHSHERLSNKIFYPRCHNPSYKFCSKTLEEPEGCDNTRTAARVDWHHELVTSNAAGRKISSLKFTTDEPYCRSAPPKSDCSRCIIERIYVQIDLTGVCSANYKTMASLVSELERRVTNDESDSSDLAELSSEEIVQTELLADYLGFFFPQPGQNECGIYVSE
jgi:hypothetical protein